MLVDTFQRAHDMLGAGGLLASVAAVACGLFSVWLSPCHLAGYAIAGAQLTQRFPASSGRLFALFVAAALAGTGLVATATIAAGRIAGDLGSAGSVLAAAMLVTAGLVLLDVVSVPVALTPGHERVASAGATVAAGGFTFATATGPCTFAFSAPLAVIDVAPFLWVLMAVLFVGGHCVGAATAWAAGRRMQALPIQGRWAGSLRHALGAIVLGLGGYWLARSIT